jgi:glycosyltransferase involved in cell wall biosynthesis
LPVRATISRSIGNCEFTLRILFLAKRRYTNKDALRERFGRVYQLPLQWHDSGQQVELALLDYRGFRSEMSTNDGFPARSLPMCDPRSMLQLRSDARRFRPDVIVASGDCLIGFAGLHLARAVGTRFVFDVYDDYSSFGGYRAFMGWDALGHLLERADLVLYASQSLAGRHTANSRWMLVPNGVDPAVFHSIPMAAAREHVGLDDAATKWVGYFGSMEPDRGVDDLIAAVGQLHASDSSIRLLLCGTPRVGMPPLPPWVDYHGIVPHTAMPYYLNACNVLALPYRRSQVMDMGVSCKIAEYLLCDRPMAATDTPNFTTNFPEQASELAPFLCRPGDPDDLARKISMQLQDPRIVSRPEGHTWSRIARDTLATLEGSSQASN